MVKEGYEIGMLGYEYKDYSELEDEKIRKDISKAQTAFRKLNIKNIQLLRAPTGHFDQNNIKNCSTSMDIQLFIGVLIQRIGQILGTELIR